MVDSRQERRKGFPDWFEFDLAELWAKNSRYCRPWHEVLKEAEKGALPGTRQEEDGERFTAYSPVEALAAMIDPAKMPLIDIEEGASKDVSAVGQSDTRGSTTTSSFERASTCRH